MPLKSGGQCQWALKIQGKNVIPLCPAAASKPSEITTRNYIKRKSRLQKTLRQMLVSCKRTPVGRGNSSTRHDQAASGPSRFVNGWSTPAPHWLLFPPSRPGVTAGCPWYPAACKAAMGRAFPQAAAVLWALPSPLSPRCPLVPTSPLPHGQLPGGKPQLRQRQNGWQSFHFNPYHKGVVLPPLLAHCCGWACIYLPMFLCFLSLCLFQGLLYFDSSPTPAVCWGNCNNETWWHNLSSDEFINHGASSK